MRKFALLTVALVGTMSLATLGGATASFADTLCLNPDAGSVDLTHDAMKPGAGWGYDKDGYDSEMSKGNRCSVTQQSQPLTNTSTTTVVKQKTHTSYN
ncbi:MAG: hypothetical protein ACTHOR_19075 [Devosia sp.]|jgi:hypothetical protein